MKAFILAAGFGTRLLPVTRAVSKVSLPLAGVPVVVRVLRELRQAGADDFLVNLHHAPDSVRGALGDFGEEPEYSIESEILGTGGALHLAAGRLEGGTFLLVNGDCHYDTPPLEEAIRFHRNKRSLATMILLDMPPGENYGAVEIDGQSRVIRIAGCPAAVGRTGRCLHFCGIHILEPQLLENVRPGFSDIVRDVYIPLLDKGAPIYGFHTEFGWQDLGTAPRLLKAQAGILRKESATPDWNFSGQECVIEAGAEFGELSVLGRSVRMAAGSMVRNSLVCDNVRLERDCRVENSIIAPGLRVRTGLELIDSLVGPGANGIELRQWSPCRR